MKKLCIVALLCMHTVVHLYSQDQQALILPSVFAIQQMLHMDYQQYLQTQLEEYKNSSTCSIETLVKMGGKIQNIKIGLLSYPKEIIANAIIDTADEQGNHFLHIAVEKEDVQSVKQLAGMRSRSTLSTNKAYQTPLDLCIAKLLSNTANHEKAKTMLEEIIYRSAHISRSSTEYTNYLTEFLKKVIATQLIYKQQSKNLDINPRYLAMLTNLNIPNDQVKSALSPFYQQATNPVDGNTFTHVLVELELPDELYEWIKDERASFAPNKAGITPVDIALTKYRSYTQQPDLIDTDKGTFQKRKCCLFMLMGHAIKLKKQALLTPYQPCCSAHQLLADVPTQNSDTV